MHADSQWFIETYDRIVREASEAGEEIALKEIMQRVAEAFAEAVESGEVTRMSASAFDEGMMLASEFIKPERTARKARLLNELDYIIDASEDETILGVNDPVFDQACPLGNGGDRTLGLWTNEDFNYAIRNRYRKASESTAAAAAFDVAASRIQNLMIVRNATYVRDLANRDGLTELDGLTAVDG